MAVQQEGEYNENAKKKIEGLNCPSLVTKLTRTRSYFTLPLENTMKRSLATPDLTFLGVGAVLAIGVYVMIAKLARDIADPAFILSIVLASTSALLSGICYAEFSSRILKCGSAYVYCNTTLGEIWAFIVGWTMILEYIIVGAVLARTCSEYINFVFGGRIYNFFRQEVGSWHYSFLAPFPDLLALLLSIALSVLVSLGLRCATIFNRAMLLFSFIAFVLIFVIGLFLVKTDVSSQTFAICNCTYSCNCTYGVQGILRAASSGYYAFIGLDIIVAASGEATNPQSAVPISVMLTVTIAAIAYCGLATFITMLTPLNKLTELAPLAKVFKAIPPAQYVVAIGAVSCCLSGLVSCLFSGPRVFFTMANDGLLFICYGCTLSDPYKVIGKDALIRGLLSGLLATVFPTDHLIDLLSIGTLLAHTMVAISVLLTRYLPDVKSVTYGGKEDKLERTEEWLQSFSQGPEIYPESLTFSSTLKPRPMVDRKRSTWNEPSKTSASNASFIVFLLVIALSCLAFTLTTMLRSPTGVKGWAFLSVGISGLFTIGSFVFLIKQPRNSAAFPVMVPFFPWLPTVTIFAHILLITELNYWTFVRFGVWLVPGLLIYGLYGYRRSTEAIKPKQSTDEDFIMYEKPQVDTHVKKIQPNQRKKQDKQDILEES